MPPAVRRAFADLPDGQIHYRHAGTDGGRAPPLVMLHASPGSSRMIEPLVGALGATRRVFAPDTLGNGDSMPPAQEVPEIADYADAVLRLMDVLGVDRADLYGTHTGARIATHLCLAHGERVRSVILDGFGLYTPDDLEEILKVYAPEKSPDQLGSHLFWAWHFIRDQYVFFPWFRRDAAHKTPLDLPPAEFLHDKFVEVMKSITTYHKSYRAAFRYDMRRNVPLIRHRTLITFAATDMVRPVMDEAVALLPGCASAALPGISTPQALAETTAAFVGFLDGNGT